MQRVTSIHFILSKKTKAKQTPFLYVPELSVAAELCSFCRTSEKPFKTLKTVPNRISEDLTIPFVSSRDSS